MHDSPVRAAGTVYQIIPSEDRVSGFFLSIFLSVFVNTGQQKGKGETDNKM